MFSRMNALHNCKNPNQGDDIKVLCICSAGLLRSPTIANELIKLGYNCRAAGIYDYALIQVDPVLIHWADLIIAANDSVLLALETIFPKETKGKEILNFKIPDAFRYNDPDLIKEIQNQFSKFNIGKMEGNK